MRNAAGERADALHALSAQELSFESFLSGDVSVDGQNGSWIFGVIAHQCPMAFGHQFLAVFRNLTQFAVPLALLDSTLLRAVKVRDIFLIDQVADILAESFFGGPA